MKTEAVHSLLGDYCVWREVQKVKELLAKNQVIDIAHNDGTYFNLAVACNSPEILEILIAYYEKTKLQGDPASLDYKHYKHKLLEILDDAGNKSNISSQIRVVLNKYVPEDEDTDREADLAEFDDLLDLTDLEEHSNQEENMVNAHENVPHLPLTEENLKLLSRTGSISMSTDDESLAEDKPNTISDSSAITQPELRAKEQVTQDTVTLEEPTQCGVALESTTEPLPGIFCPAMGDVHEVYDLCP